MKVLFTMTPAFNPNAGGVQRTTFKLGKYFTEKGLDVGYYSSANEGHVEVEYGRLVHGKDFGGVNSTNNIDELRSFIRKFQPDVVINQMPYEAPLRQALSEEKEQVGYLLLGCLRNSLFNFKNNARDRIRQLLPQPVSTLMDNTIGESIVQWRHKLKHARDLKAIIDQHDYFILLAPPNKEELQYFVGDYKSEKVVAIPNSIPNVAPALPQKAKIILHVGRLNIQQKRSDLLLPFWEQLYDQLPDWHFVIVGDGPYYEKLQYDIQKKQMPRITLEGYQKPESYYEKAAIFMMPSAYEGFPNTLLEAQSIGCVPLAFDNYAALSWIVNNEWNAYLCPPFDVGKMAGKAKELSNDKMALLQMQQSALDNAKRFTIERVGQQWLDFFEKKRQW